MNTVTVTFLPDGRSVQVEEGTSLFKAAAEAGIELKSTCGNEGTCGRCGVRVKEGKVRSEEGNVSARVKKKGLVLACHTFATGDVTVEVPRDSRLDEHQVLLEDQSQEIKKEKDLNILADRGLAPICRKIRLELTPPSLDENTSDLSRLTAELKRHTGTERIELKLPVLQNLAETLRRAEWKITVTVSEIDDRLEIIRVEEGLSTRPTFGLAIDIGTTTVVVDLVDLDTGAIVDKAGTYNRQARYGDDVISRIVYANKEGGLESLHKAVLKTINELTERLLADNNVLPEEVVCAVAAGNTIMTHLFWGLPPKYIRLEPYIPTATDFPVFPARELGLAINPLAPVLSFPSVASYVGGDIVSGVLVTGQAKSQETVLFIDIGTNGEIVLGNSDWLMCCACSAGPAFEGAGITNGMRAMNGAIERVEIEPGSFEVKIKTIGGYPPIGICGSGLIDTIAKLRHSGLIDRTGQFMDVETPRLRQTDDGPEFVLAWAAETENGKDIVITENDIKNLIRSKGAVYAGIQSLLKTVELPLEVIDKIRIAGGFGNYLNVPDAVEIGLLPDLPPEKYEFVGNTSIKGAQLVLLAKEAYQEAVQIGRAMTYIELSVGNIFMDEFVSACFLPHTDLSLFPSLAENH